MTPADKTAVGLSEESGVYVPEAGVIIWTRPGSGLDGHVITVDPAGNVDPAHDGDLVVMDAAGPVTDPYADDR